MKSLKAKLIYMIIGLVVTAHVTTGWIILHRVETAMDYENHRRGLAIAFDLSHAAARSLVSLDLPQLKTYVGYSMAQEYVVQAMVLDANDRIVMHNDLTKVGTYYSHRNKFSTQHYSVHYQADTGEQIVDILVPIELGQTNFGSAVISLSHAGITKAVQELKKQIFLIMISGMTVAALCAVFVAEYITRPLKYLRGVASDLSCGSFNIKKMDTDYGDELGDLTRSFYDMAGKLEKEVCYDALTGLFSRSVFQVRLAEETAHSKRHNQFFSILMLDVDHFKAVNDTYGHLAGDKVLQIIAALMQEQVRKEDCVARYGGEEFVILLPQTEAKGALHVAEKIRRKVEEQAIALEDGTTIPLTISVGVAVFPEDSTDSNLVLAYADQALYTAKERGRNRVCLSPTGTI